MTTQKKLVATGNQYGVQYINPGHAWEMVYADKAIELATELGWDNPAPDHPFYWSKQTKLEAIMFIAAFIAMPPPLPFDDAINGWRGEE